MSKGRPKKSDYIYKPAETSVLINDDRDLTPIRLSLPAPPEYPMIAGYGLHPDEQYFRRMEIPDKLKDIERQARKELKQRQEENRQFIITGSKMIAKFWEIFEERRRGLTEEIKWLKAYHWHRQYGYWFFNDGRPTYITGDHFDYLQHWLFVDEKTNDEGRPEYRDADRRRYIFRWYAEHSTETFMDYDHDGIAVKKDGKYRMQDIGMKICYGTVEPKFRRCGVTGQGVHQGMKRTLSNFGQYATILSFDGNNAEVHYDKKLLPAWREYPIFLKAQHKNSTSNGLVFSSSASYSDELTLQSIMDYTDSAGERKNDGDKLHYLLADEEGKCLSDDTQVLMYDGSVLFAPEVKEGDVLMGDDGGPRNVLSTVRGTGQMYRILSKKGEEWGCNDAHILTLLVSDSFKSYKKGDIIDVPLQKYLSWSDRHKKSVCLYRVPVDYPSVEHVVDPYLLGVWLGDGNAAGSRISNVDPEIILGDIGVIGNKHIPQEYLIDSRENRLQLLAGLVDADGLAMKAPKMGYEITQKRKELAYGIQRLALSLGFYASLNDQVATMKREDGSIYKCNVYVVKIFGNDLDVVPCKVARKKYEKRAHHPNTRNPRKFSFAVEPDGVDDYYGFIIDGNRRFLLYDYTVAHNTTSSDIFERWNVNKMAMSKGGGSGIIGFSVHPTTVEDMDDGGMQYMHLCQASKFYERTESGQTQTGLWEMFIPAWDGQEGFVDRFGQSVIDSPTERQKKLRPNATFARLDIGAREYLQRQLDAVLRKGTPEAKEAYRSLKRKLPMCYADCWLGSSGDVGFDMDIIDTRLAELRKKSAIRPGFFKWKGAFGGPVEWVDDPEGKFEISKMLSPDEHSKMIREDVIDHVTGEWREQWAPAFPYRFTAGADPFQYGTSNDAKKTGTRSAQSDGGFAVLWEWDESIDPIERSIRDRESHRFVCSYRYRPPSAEEYAEDVLMACIYFGAMLFLERNMTTLWGYFDEWGFGGYLMHEIDRHTGKKAEKPGFAAYERQKNELFTLTKDYIRYRGHIERHATYLEECKNIHGKDQMGKFDRFTAHGAALMGSKHTALNRMRYEGSRPKSGDIDTIIDMLGR